MTFNPEAQCCIDPMFGTLSFRETLFLGVCDAFLALQCMVIVMLEQGSHARHMWPLFFRCAV